MATAERQGGTGASVYAYQTQNSSVRFFRQTARLKPVATLSGPLPSIFMRKRSADNRTALVDSTAFVVAGNGPQAPLGCQSLANQHHPKVRNQLNV